MAYAKTTSMMDIEPILESTLESSHIMKFLRSGEKKYSHLEFIIKKTIIIGMLRQLFNRYSAYSFATSFSLHIVQLVKDIGYLLLHF